MTESCREFDKTIQKTSNQKTNFEIKFISNLEELALPRLDVAKPMKQIHNKLDRMASSLHLNFYSRDIAKTAAYHPMG